jgi:hypothetical protein
MSSTPSVTNRFCPLSFSLWGSQALGAVYECSRKIYCTIGRGSVQSLVLRLSLVRESNSGEEGVSERRAAELGFEGYQGSIATRYRGGQRGGSATEVAGAPSSCGWQASWVEGGSLPTKEEGSRRLADRTEDGTKEEGNHEEKDERGSRDRALG